ncbi:MAG TPA: dihydropteroate synthase [Cellvibrionaceae bacterium]|nr:dihydropteroate synthase [Cellvibrionaceae bacterium]
MNLACGRRLLDLSSPKIMGILNTTPDSFSDGGALYEQGNLNSSIALKKAEQMLAEGAALIDVGGESTRPGAAPVSLQEELDRVVGIVELIAARLDVVISVDTSKPEVMRAAAAAGAGFINDVRALQWPGALEAASQLDLPICLMHKQGEPGDMQTNPSYRHVDREVRDFFYDSIQRCSSYGISAQRLVLDPGFGFGKTDAHNLDLFKALTQFADIGCPLLVGISRKSMIGRLLGRELTERLPGSLGFGLVALQRGAKILRVHDVAASRDIVKVYELTC